MTLEVVVAFISVGKYLGKRWHYCCCIWLQFFKCSDISGKTIKFNIDKPLPDVNQDNLFASFSQIELPQTEVGFKYVCVGWCIALRDIYLKYPLDDVKLITLFAGKHLL